MQTINKHGVAQKVETIQIFQQGWYLLTLHIGEYKGRWNFGYNFKAGDTGSSVAVWFKEDVKHPTYSSREKALEAGYKTLNKEIAKWEAFDRYNKFPSAGKKALLIFYKKLFQKTLF